MREDESRAANRRLRRIMGASRMLRSRPSTAWWDRLRVAAAALLAAAAGAWVSWPAAGHAYLVRSQPADGATLSEAPRGVCLVFSEPVELRFSRFEVTDSSGQPVHDAEGLPAVVARWPVTAKVPLPLQALGPGQYQVSWRVLSVDTHITSGSIAFSIRGGTSPAPQQAVELEAICRDV